MSNRKGFKVGDVVTRDGTDRQKVVSVDEEWGTMIVECVRAPKSRWMKKGEKESNLMSRYVLVKKEPEK